MFAPADEPAFAYGHLKRTKQGPTPIEDFISEFKTYVRCSGITDKPVIIDLFRQAINPSITLKIDTQITPPTTIADWYSQA